MKKHRRFLTIGLVVLSFLLSGCGTQLYELTADEEELIVKYAAYYVAKRNIYQKDGISVVYVEDIELEEPDNTQEPDNTDNDIGDAENNPISMAEAAGLPDDIQITYKGGSVEEYIQQSPAYVVSPKVEGNRLYVVKLEMKNMSDKEVVVNNLSSDMSFKLVCGDIATSHHETFLDNDFSLYNGTVDAGQSVEVLLIFEIKSTDVDKIIEPILQIKRDGKTTDIHL